MTKTDSRIRLIEQLDRKGKASAINIFISKANAQVLVAISGDLRLHTNAIEEITLPFLHTNVGICGAHPIPINTQHNPLGDEIRLLWHLHHLVSLSNPKCGEMVAFRNVIRSIPKESAVDEATIEVLLKLIGYKVVYAPRAIIYNHGPKTLKEFFTQRRRVHAGHTWIQTRYNYQVSTRKIASVISLIGQYLLDNPKDIWPMARLIIFEIYGRFLGWLDYHVFGVNPYIWNMIKR